MNQTTTFFKSAFQNILLIFAFASFVLSTSLNAQGQEFYYTFDNEKIFLNEVSGKYVLEFASKLDEPDSTMITSDPFNGRMLAAKLFEVDDTLYLEDSLSQSYISNYPRYQTTEGSNIYLMDAIMLLPKEGVSQSYLDNLVTEYDLTLEKEKNAYIKYTTSNALEKAKQIYEEGNMVFCFPSFSSDVEFYSNPPNDEYFHKQFYLYNTGQVINDGHSGTPGADIKILGAWNITKGSPSIIIGLVDHGVQGNHPDLPSSSQLRLPGSNLVDEIRGPNNPSPNSGQYHGMAVAGIISAAHNQEGIAGIAPDCKLMPVRIIATYEMFTDGVEFAHTNGAHIINCSWGGHPSTVNQPNHHPALITAIKNASDDGVFLFFATGHFSDHSNNIISGLTFPMNNQTLDKVVRVGASNRYDLLSNYGAIDENNEIVAPSHNTNTSTETFEIWTTDNIGVYGNNPYVGGNTWGSFPAYGEVMPNSGTNYLDYSGRFGGTSASAPMLSGIAALVLSENDCLTPLWMKDILLSTADKVGGYNYNWTSAKQGHSKELGYGRANAHRAVEAAGASYSSTLDLYIKDRPDDLGYINSYPWGWWFDNSPDIWVRNQPDGFDNHEHEELHLGSSATTAYVYVRVRNKSCVTSTGDGDNLKVYWSRAATSSGWPIDWDGTDPLIGNVVNEVSIPILEPGESVILELEWDLNGINTSNTPVACLLARIESLNDPIQLYGPLEWDVYYNNNIAMKNLTIVRGNSNMFNGILMPPGNVFAIGNPGYAGSGEYDFIFTPDGFSELIVEEAEIQLGVGDDFWDVVGQSSNVQFDDIDIIDNNRLHIKSKDSKITGLRFEEREMIQVYLGFGFYGDQAGDDDITYMYHVGQNKHNMGDSLMGGMHFLVEKNARDGFEAYAGEDEEIYTGQTTTLNAAQINEPAYYNWYAGDSLIDTTLSVAVHPDSATNYKLEVIAKSDGFKAYDDVTITVKHNWLVSLTPNPATNQVTVEYDLKAGTSIASIKISSVSGTYNQQYSLDINETTKSIDLSNYPSGLYVVTLQVGGESKQSLNLLIQ